MQWSDEALVLQGSPYGESARILQLFTLERGRHAGLVRSRRKSGSECQPGNRVQVCWNARLEDHLGTLTLEILRPTASLLFEDAPKLHAISSACTLLSVTLPEREPYPELYLRVRAFLAVLETDNPLWVAHYLALELELLARLGYGLELGHCAATGAAEHLIYVSPKTGRAVSAAGGEPYKDKLLRLPPFLKKSAEGEVPATLPGIAEIIDGFRLTGYFLNKHIFSARNAMPAVRGRLMESFREQFNEQYEYA